MAINFNAPSQVRPYANLGAFPATGTLKTIYIAEDTNYIYRWNGTAYIEISVADLVGYVPYSGATQDVNLGAYDAYVNKLWLYDAVNDNYGSTHYTDGNYHIEDADGHKLLVIEDGFIQLHKTDTIQSNLFTSGLTATRDHYLPDASGTIALTSNLAGYVPTSRTLTINGTTQDLSADRTFTISTGITIGTTAITSGTVGRVLFEGSGNVVQESANLFWNNATSQIQVIGTGLFSAGTNSNIRLSGGGIEFSRTIDGAFNTYITKNGSTNSVGLTFAALNGGSFIFQGTSEIMRTTSTNNLLIGTATDAGFKLDVNGTARVSGNLLSGNGTYFTTGSQSIASASTANAFMEISSGAANSASLVFSKAGSLSTLWQFYCDSSNNLAFFRNGVNKETFKLFESTKNVGIDEVSASSTFTDVASAKLFVNSTTKGFLPPRLTTTQKNAIASPVAGLMVYDTTLNLISVYNGTTWITL